MVLTVGISLSVVFHTFVSGLGKVRGVLIFGSLGVGSRLCVRRFDKWSSSQSSC